MADRISKIKRILFVFCLMQVLTPISLMALWTPFQYISSPTEDSLIGQDVSLDVNSSNNGVAVWINDLAVFLRTVQASSYFFGTGWTPPVTIISTALNSEGNRIFSAPFHAAVAMNESGQAVAVWEANEFLTEFQPPDDTLQGVYAASRDSNGNWGPQQRMSNLVLVSQDSLFFPHSPNIAVSDSGLAVSAWLEERTGEDDNAFIHVMTSFLPLGGVWTTPVEISGPYLYTSDILNTPSIAIDQNNNATITWRLFTNDSPFAVVGAATYDPATNIWTTVNLDPGGNEEDGRSELPRTDMDANGNAVVVWNWQNEDIYRVYGAIFTHGIGWGPSTIIIETDDETLADANVTMDPFGNSTAIWVHRGVPVLGAVVESSRNTGFGWSSPVVISTTSTFSFIDGDLVTRPIDSDLEGNVIAIYYGDSETTTDLFSAIFRIDTGLWETPEIIDAAYIGLSASVGYGSCDFAIAAWEQFDSATGFTRVAASEHFGLATVPCNFRGTTCFSKFATQKIYSNILTWDNCTPGCTAFFRLYRNGVLIATIRAFEGTLTYTFADPFCCRRACAIYSLSTVDIFGIESEQVSIAVPANCAVIPLPPG